MEVLAMGPSQNAYTDPAYTGQTPNMFLTSVGRQQGQDQRQSSFAAVPGQFAAHGPGTLSSHSTEFSDENMDSPHMSNVSWEDFAATQWEEHARMLEQQQGQTPRGTHVPQTAMRFTSAPSNTDFSVSDHGLLSASQPAAGTSTMDFSLSTSVSPGPEMLNSEAFASSVNAAPFASGALGTMPSLQETSQARHRHIQSTPSPAPTSDSPETLRRKSAPAPPKSVAGTSNKVTKGSPKPGASQSPANSRSAHSAIERKYRENINSKIMELHKVLCSATPPLFPDQDTEPGGYPYARIQRPDEDDELPDGLSVSGQTTLPAKKADVLAGAVAYVRRSEREKRALMERLNASTARLQQFEHAMAQARVRSMGGP